MGFFIRKAFHRPWQYVYLLSIALALALVSLVSQYYMVNSTGTIITGTCLDNPIDVVFTWVNGSDPDLLASLSRYKKQDDEDRAHKRYMDWGTLKYSLRSIHMFAPWVRNIYLVTNGQVPNWLNPNAGVRVVTHYEIFEVKEALPTFNSNAIELFIHKIPGLSDKFMFFNDDTLLGSELRKEDICHGYNGQKLYLGGYPVRHCQEGCKNERLGDGVCHTSCNSSACLYDKGDCDKPEVKVDNNTFDSSGSDKWYKSLTMWNTIFNNDFEFAERNYPMHQGFLLDKSVKNDFNKKYSSYVNNTAFSKFRSSKDVQLQFTYFNYLIGTANQMAKEKNIIKNVTDCVHSIDKINPRYCNTVVRDDSIGRVILIENDIISMAKKLDNAKKTGLPTYMCLQDATQNPDAHTTNTAFKIVNKFLEAIYPLKYSFEVE